MRVLVVTKIFPNALEPSSSTFNRQQFAALGRLCHVEVLATIPWLPAPVAWFAARTRRLADVPARETIDGLDVEHPRFAYVPKIGDAVAGPLYAASLLAPIRRRRCDVMLGAWVYPDGWAAVMLGRLLRIPVVLKAHGSDLHVLGERRAVRAHLRWALPRAGAVVAPSRPLVERAIALGARADRAVVVSNGVDATRFAPSDRGAARSALGLPREGRLVVYVGRLERQKGTFDLLDAFEQLAARAADVRLVLVGDGDAKREVAERAARSGGRVQLVGARPHEELAQWYAAADVVTLPSWSEGTPNVVLEALACGRRVVATRVGGIPDLIHADVLGTLVPARDPTALSAALFAGLESSYDPTTVRAAARLSSWDDSARTLHDVLARAALPRRGPAS